MGDYLKDLRSKVGHVPLVVPHSVVVVMNQNGEILLEERADDGYYDFPGGGIDPGETCEETAKRELLEETGLTALELTLFNVYSGEITHYTYTNGDEIYGVDHIYLCTKYQGTLIPQGEEVKSLKFYNFNSVPKKMSIRNQAIIKDICMNLAEVVEKFTVYEPAVEISPLGNGHINSTFFVKIADGREYVLQRINTTVFKDVDLLMDNCHKVSKYLRHHGFESLKVIHTRDGQLYYRDGPACYRLYVFIENTICYEAITSKDLLVNAGKAFGKLHKALAAFDASELGEVIPNFHNTPKRFENLLDAIELNKCDRVNNCLPEIADVKALSKDFSRVVDGIKDGSIRFAVTHNDPKINNVLFDKTSGEIRAVVDLDTVMPGSYLYDFGDAMRSLFTGDNEDSKDLSKLTVKDDIFENYARGYLSEMKDVLSPRERELLPFSAFLLTIECGTRFLEDYLRGDVYFQTAYDEHNLVRARTQIKLAKEIYQSFDRLSAIIDKLMKE